MRLSVQDRNEIITTTRTSLVPTVPKTSLRIVITGSGSSPLMMAPKSLTASSSERQTSVEAAPPM